MAEDAQRLIAPCTRPLAQEYDTTTTSGIAYTLPGLSTSPFGTLLHSLL